MKQNAQKLATCLWFNNNAEEAVDCYESIFKNNLKRSDILRWGDAGGVSKGSVLTSSFYLYGQEFIALNGGPEFKFTEAVSICVNCDTQEEIDELWEKLSAGGEKSMCGWLKDKFGLSWQVTPPVLVEMLLDKDQKKADSVMKAMMQMNKIDIKKLQEAYNAA
ncbi:VOC family protein [Pseudoflavitalea sp. X16]|uniref:VOC family protein n=1 Tax=Paraflavitalea devenefica TaxID=2716334 RepID=UPI0014206E55|nr:VOC family protein [Paraflavitalea devenefica]NII28115.1 VOC family protein [Paraflavitalea devenefica]